MFNITISRPAPKVNPAKEIAIDIAKGIAVTTGGMIIGQLLCWAEKCLTSKSEENT